MILKLSSSVQFSRSVMSDSLQPHELQHARPPCPSPSPSIHSNSCPLSQWYHPAISSSVVPFSSCPQSLPASGSFPMSQLFASGGQSIGFSALASVLPMNTQDWSPLVWTGWTSLQSKRTGHGTTDWFQIRKGVHQGCILSPCLCNLYVTPLGLCNLYVTPLGWKKHKLESRLPGEISITSDMQTPPLRQKKKRD